MCKQFVYLKFMECVGVTRNYKIGSANMVRKYPNTDTVITFIYYKNFT